MESRDLVSVSRRVSRPVFCSLGLCLEGLRSRLGLEGFRSPSRALRLETLHRLFFMKFCKKEFHKKTVLKNGCSKFSRSRRSVAKLYLLSCCLRDVENDLPSTPLKSYTEFINICITFLLLKTFYIILVDAPLMTPISYSSAFGDHVMCGDFAGFLTMLVLPTTFP